MLADDPRVILRREECVERRDREIRLNGGYRRASLRSQGGIVDEMGAAAQDASEECRKEDDEEKEDQQGSDRGPR